MKPGDKPSSGYAQYPSVQGVLSSFAVDPATSSPSETLSQLLKGNVDIAATPRWNEIPHLTRNVKQVVLLIHGIRTQAEWQGMVRSALDVPGERIVYPVKYGYFHVLRFWIPFFTRAGVINEILWRVEKALADNKDAEFIIIAHSFGTYSIARILQEKPYIRPARIILCGSVIHPNFRWDRLPHHPIVINDCGSRDIWPILAGSLSWGYGPSGTFGFGTPGVRDRHHDIKHSDYFNRDFVSQFWLPFVESGQVIPSQYDSAQPAIPYHLSFLSICPFQWLILAAICFLFWCVFTHLPS